MDIPAAAKRHSGAIGSAIAAHFAYNMQPLLYVTQLEAGMTYMHSSRAALAAGTRRLGCWITTQRWLCSLTDCSCETWPHTKAARAFYPPACKCCSATAHLTTTAPRSGS